MSDPTFSFRPKQSMKFTLKSGKLVKTQQDMEDVEFKVDDPNLKPAIKSEPADINSKRRDSNLKQTLNKNSKTNSQQYPECPTLLLPSKPQNKREKQNKILQHQGEMEHKGKGVLVIQKKKGVITQDPNEDLASKLKRRLKDGSYECMICYDAINNRIPTWSCQVCFAVIHLKVNIPFMFVLFIKSALKNGLKNQSRKQT